MKNEDVVSTLNNLIETSKDGEEGFRHVAENIKDPQLKSTFTNRAESCTKAAQELQQLVRAYGGNPETDSSMSGSLHRRWVDIKGAITGQDDVSILNECERGEDVAKESYRKALEQDLPADARAVVERQYQGVLQNHDMVKRLREQYKARNA